MSVPHLNNHLPQTQLNQRESISNTFLCNKNTIFTLWPYWINSPGGMNDPPTTHLVACNNKFCVTATEKWDNDAESPFQWPEKGMFWVTSNFWHTYTNFGRGRHHRKVLWYFTGISHISVVDTWAVTKTLTMMILSNEKQVSSRYHFMLGPVEATNPDKNSRQIWSPTYLIKE